MAISGFHWSCNGDIRDPIKLHRGSLASFLMPGETWDSLKSQQGNRASSQVEAGNSGFLSCCDRYLRILSRCDENLTEPLRLPHWSQASFRVARVISEFLLSRFREIGPHLNLRWETQGSSSVVTEISAFLSSCSREVRTCLVLRHGTPISS